MENSETRTILENVYVNTNSAFDENDFKIKSSSVQIGNVKYLDEYAVEEPIKGGYIRENINFNNNIIQMFGGSKKVRAAKDEILYQSLADVPDADVKKFIDTCKLSYVVSTMKPNSIYIIPDKNAFKEIEDNISKNLGSVKRDSPEGVMKIKTMPLLYKSFIIDVYGDDKTNEGFEYRIDNEYPAKINDKIIRRTSRNNDVYYIQVDKTGINISLDKNDIHSGTHCDFVMGIGKLPNYISFVFKGSIPMEKKKNAVSFDMKKKRGINNKRRLQNLLNDNVHDKEYGAYKFVADMIKSHGVDECLPCYSANMINTAFSMINKFGGDELCGDVCDDNEIEDYHMQVLTKYTPVQNNKINSTNLKIMHDFNEKYLDANNTSIGNYLSQVKRYYSKMANAENVDDDIAVDIASGVYNNSNSVELACDVMSEVKSNLNNSIMRGGGVQDSNKLMLNTVLHAMDDNVLGNLSAKQYYPMIYNKKKRTRKNKKRTPKRKNVAREVELEFGKESSSEHEMEESMSSVSEDNVDNFLNDM